MAETFNLNFLPPSVATWLINTTPFFPNIKEIGEVESVDKIEITFNKGYIFDYANKGGKIEVFTASDEAGATLDTKMTLDKAGLHELKIRLVVDNGTGEISQIDDLKPRIIKTGADIPNSPKGGAATTEFTNLKIINELGNLSNEKTESAFPDGGDKPKGDHQYIDLDFCVIENGILKELFIRENVHVWFRGVRVLRPTQTFLDDYGTDVRSILKFGDEENANGLLDFKSILIPAMIGDTSNGLTVYEDGETIALWVQGSTT